MSMTPEQFEIARKRLDLDFTAMALLLGVAKPRMCEYANGKRPIPGYVEASINAHLLLADDDLDLLKKMRKVYDKDKRRNNYGKNAVKANNGALPAAA